MKWIEVKDEKCIPKRHWDDDITYVVRVYHDDRGSHIEELPRNEIWPCAKGNDGRVFWLDEYLKA